MNHSTVQHHVNVCGSLSRISTTNTCKQSSTCQNDWNDVKFVALTAASAGRYHHFVAHVRNHSEITHAVASGIIHEARARENGYVITERTRR
ncbi:hypothetical protein CY34DRAFT_803153 [Suillus luteus UH-Slu-Lm8-n1]|uniref:Uncharacterized protein n=1 Tax=Suillus luteus UH-Slu-Lm8-n1 TaxID=930992 RepID=A0A0D0AQN8_9AGAM|nr:hypothetical protein CY34DRAFT_803153 [Suillus luteus UH-Slu-Lm8-n1]